MLSVRLPICLNKPNLKFYPYDAYDKFQKALKPVSEKEIEPAFVICPTSWSVRLCHGVSDCVLQRPIFPFGYKKLAGRGPMLRTAKTSP